MRHLPSWKATTVVLATLTIGALAVTLLTWSWANPAERLRALGAGRGRGPNVDTRPLAMAQQLAQLAETRTEKGYAEEALRSADYSVDFAFAAALREAANAPAPTDSATREITTRLKGASAVLLADSAQVVALGQQITRAPDGARGDLQQRLDLARAKLELDRDDVEDARQDLIRAGGDRLAVVERLRTQHEAAQHTAGSPNAGTPAAGTAPVAAAEPPSIELTKSSSILDQAAAWRSLNAKRTILGQARQNAIDRTRAFQAAHDTLEKEVAREKAEQAIVHQKGRNAATVALERSAATKPAGTRDSSPKRPAADTAPATALSFLQDLTVDQKDLSELDKRIDNEQDLSALYDRWGNYVRVRQQRFVHGMVQTAFWALLIALLVLGATAGVRRVFSDVTATHRGLDTARTALLFAVQAAGILVILLLIFGVPGNPATAVALVGAGLAVALQDFILGFLGWFVLMGKDGIRPGDWVEINGVGGEVLEVGIFRTVLLETGNWSKSAHPTGRKVSFVNRFAIEGHFFNFSTSGQWLWDEVEVQVPDTADPYAVAEEMQRLAVRETGAHAGDAEQEWRRVVPAAARQAFTAEPTVSVRPSGNGVTVTVRYVSRASERQEIRARIYRAVIELLHRRSGASPATA